MKHIVGAFKILRSAQKELSPLHLLSVEGKEKFDEFLDSRVGFYESIHCFDNEEDAKRVYKKFEKIVNDEDLLICPLCRLSYTRFSSAVLYSSSGPSMCDECYCLWASSP